MPKFTLSVYPNAVQVSLDGELLFAASPLYGHPSAAIAADLSAMISGAGYAVTVTEFDANGNALVPAE